jgi:glycerol-3-phosphate dehydrogenase
MAEDAVDQAATLARLPDRDCATRTLNIHGFHPSAERFGSLSVYGADALGIQELIAGEPASASRCIPRSPAAVPR